MKFTNTLTQINDQVIREDMLVQKPIDPIKTFYAFNTWLLNGQPFDFTKPITDNITLTADFKEIGYPKVTVKLKEVSNTREFTGYLAGELPKGEDTNDGMFTHWLLNGKEVYPSYELRQGDVFTPAYVDWGNTNWKIKVYYPVFKKEVLNDTEVLGDYDKMREKYWLNALSWRKLKTDDYHGHNYISFIQVPKGYKLFMSFNYRKSPLSDDVIINPKVINGITYSELDNDTYGVTLCLIKE